MNKVKTTCRAFALVATIVLSGCATLTEPTHTTIALSFSDGSEGKCNLKNKRGFWTVGMPDSVSVRKSDDSLVYDCQTEDGRQLDGAIPSTMGGKIIASAVFLDFGIVNAITDKHRKYPASFVIPAKKIK